MNRKVVGVALGGVVAIGVIAFLLGMFLNKPDESAHQTAQTELRKTIKDRDEELKRLEIAHKDEIAALNKLHAESMERLKAELATKATVVDRQDKEIDSKDQSLLGWKTRCVGCLVIAIVLFGIGVWVGAAYAGAATKHVGEASKKEGAV